MGMCSTETFSTAGYGPSRPVRYYIESASDFREVLDTLNQIIGRANSLDDVICCQQSAQFEAIPLAASGTRFIAIFHVPIKLLGDDHHKRPILVDSYDDDRARGLCSERGGGKIRYSFPIANLYDVNSAFYHVEAEIARATPSAQWARRLRSFDLELHQGVAADDPPQLIFVVGDAPAA